MAGGYTLAEPKAERAKESATCAQRPKGGLKIGGGADSFQSPSLTTWERAAEQRECRVRARLFFSFRFVSAPAFPRHYSALRTPISFNAAFCYNQSVLGWRADAERGTPTERQSGSCQVSRATTFVADSHFTRLNP